MASSIRSSTVTAGRCPYRVRLADRGTGLEPARSTDSAAASAIPPIGGRKYIADMFQVPAARVAALDRVAHRDEVRRQSEVLHEVGELIVGHVLEEPVLLPMVLEHARVVLDPVEPHASAAPDEVVGRGLVLCLVCEVEEVVSLLEARWLRFAGPAAPVREQPRWQTRQGSGREGSRQKLPPRKWGKREPSSLGHEVTIRHRAEYRLPAPHSCRSRPAHTRRAACCSRRARTCCSSSGSSRTPARNRSHRPGWRWDR